MFSFMSRLRLLPLRWDYNKWFNDTPGEHVCLLTSYLQNILNIFIPVLPGSKWRVFLEFLIRYDTKILFWYYRYWFFFFFCSLKYRYYEIDTPIFTGCPKMLLCVCFSSPGSDVPVRSGLQGRLGEHHVPRPGRSRNRPAGESRATCWWCDVDAENQPIKSVLFPAVPGSTPLPVLLSDPSRYLLVIRVNQSGLFSSSRIHVPETVFLSSFPVTADC